MRSSILTEPAETQGLRHDPTTIWLHWATALLVVLLWVIGQTIDFAPRGPWRVGYRSIHILAGVALAIVLAGRIGWRLTRGGMLPPLDTGPLLLVARGTHILLYALMVATVGLGLFNAWVRGDTLFGLVTLPAFDPSDPALRRTIGGWHELGANALLIVAGIHAAAGLFHHLVLRDQTLRRMWFARRRQS